MLVSWFSHLIYHPYEKNKDSIESHLSGLQAQALTPVQWATVFTETQVQLLLPITTRTDKWGQPLHFQSGKTMSNKRPSLFGAGKKAATIWTLVTSWPTEPQVNKERQCQLDKELPCPLHLKTISSSFFSPRPFPSDAKLEWICT